MEETNIVKTSAFRQKTYAKRYDICSECSPYWGTQKQHYLELWSTNELLDDKEIFRCSLEMPLLEDGDKFLIEELNQLVTIRGRYRSSSDVVVYYIEDKYLEDEKTEESRIVAEEKLIKYKEQKDKIDSLKTNVDYLNTALEKTKSMLSKRQLKKLTR